MSKTRVFGVLLVLAELVEFVCCYDWRLCPSNKSSELLVRKRRYLAFPNGSSFVATLSQLKGIMVTEPSNWNVIDEFDVSWPIPNIEENLRKTFLKKAPSYLKRRHKRELYSVVRAALDSRNLPGRECVLRAICESNWLLEGPHLSFTEMALRIVLSNAEENVRKHDEYDVAYRSRPLNCHETYPCPFSLLQLLLYTLYS